MKRIAMWSGPRNISTALMRSFENRADCVVVDEPFYGYYLQATGLEHPGHRKIVSAMDRDWRSVSEALVSFTAEGFDVCYQKHMCQHLLPEVDLAFTDSLLNCFLIREPRRIIASYVRVRADFTLEELGFPRQLELFERVCERTGEIPPVLDSGLTLANPEAVLRKLCQRLEIPFSTKMLRWPAGPRASDGVWAPHWYSAVEQSTGFAEPPAGDLPPIPDRYRALAVQAEEIYQRLHAHAIRP